ncbi:hypothetical protein Tco_0023699 [Tanacetum coccineum]
MGAIIGEGTIKLQPHIIKKIVNFNKEELNTKKGLRSFLGILNYARNHIQKLGILLKAPLRKTNAHGDKRPKPSDYELVRKIKEQVQNLLDLEIPPENAYMILETDGCMEGWGGIVKWKKLQGGSKKFRKNLQRNFHLGNQTPIRMDKSDAWRSIAQELELSAAKEAVKAMRHLQATIQYKAQICFGKSTKDNHWSDQREDVRVQNKKPKESSLNLKPWHKDWDAITSNYSEDNVIKDEDNDDDKYRYNRKGFLEDDESSDDSDFYRIVTAFVIF